MPVKSRYGPAAAAAPHRIPAAAYLLAACLAVIGSNAFALGAIASAIARTFAVTGPDVMVAATCYGAGTALSALCLSGWIDRLGVFRSLRLAVAVFVAAMGLGAAATSVVVLAAGETLAGVAAGVAVPAIYAGALAVAPPGKESRTIGVGLGGWTLSLMAGVALSTVLTQYLGWRSVFGVNAAAAAVIWLAMRRLEDPAGRPVQVRASPLRALSIPGIHGLLLACAGAMAAFYGLYSYLGDYIHERLDQPLVVNGVATCLYGAGFGAATCLDGLVDRLGARRLTPAAFLIGAGFYAAIGLAGAPLVAVLALFAGLGVVNHLQVNLLVTRMTGTDPGHKGAILGLNTAVTYVGSLAGTAAFGPLYAHAGFPAAAIASALLMVAATAAAAWPQPQP